MYSTPEQGTECAGPSEDAEEMEEGEAREGEGRDDDDGDDKDKVEEPGSDEDVEEAGDKGINRPTRYGLRIEIDEGAFQGARVSSFAPTTTFFDRKILQEVAGEGRGESILGCVFVQNLFSFSNHKPVSVLSSAQLWCQKHSCLNVCPAFLASIPSSTLSLS